MTWLCRSLHLAAVVATLAVSPVPPAHADLFVSSALTDQVLRYSQTTGAFVGVFASGGGLARPQGLGFGLDGHLYVASGNTDQVLRYQGTTGAFVDVFVAAGSGGLNEPRGLVFGPDGHLYVSSEQSNQVLRYHGITGTLLGAFASGGGLSGPRGLAFGPDGHLYVVSFGTNSVKPGVRATGLHHPELRGRAMFQPVRALDRGARQAGDHRGLRPRRLLPAHPHHASTDGGVPRRDVQPAAMRGRDGQGSGRAVASRSGRRCWRGRMS